MWFRFPEGTTGITVEQQQFVSEAKDDAGREYFRAPDHFAGRILDHKGFEQAKPPNSDLPDLAPTSETSAVTDLAAQLETVRLENGELRAGLSELAMQRDLLRVELADVKTKLSNAESDLESAQAKIEELTPKKK